MATKLQIARSAASNWTALLINVVVGFFMSPFLVRTLGSDAYGVWTFVNSSIAFMSLLDLGLRGTVTRFVARDHARGDHETVSRTVSTIFWFRTSLGLLAFVIGAAASGAVAGSIEMPPELQSDARWAIVVLSASFAVTFSSGVFGGVLAAFQRFDLLSGVSILQTLLRAGAAIWLLRSGHSVLSLAILDFCLVSSIAVAFRLFVRRVYPDFRVTFRLPNRAGLKEIIGYSFYAYVINVCIQIVYYTDNIIVGTALSAAAVTYYSIGGGLVEYLRQIVSSLTVPFTPLASRLDGAGNQDKLRQLLVYGTRAALLIALPIAAALFTRGETFIGLWMGQQYAETSGQVLTILLSAALVAVANTTSGGIGLGLGKHKVVAFWAIGEAACNLTLSLILVRTIGITGVAWGVAIPSVLIHVLLWPRYICGIVGLPVRTYIWQCWLRPLLAVVPFAAACYWADTAWSPSNVFTFFAQIIVLLPIFALGALLCFWKEAHTVLQSERMPAPLRRLSLLLSGRNPVRSGG